MRVIMTVMKMCRVRLCPGCNGMLIVLSKNKQKTGEEEEEKSLCTVRPDLIL